MELPSMEGRGVVLVDDGIAMGSTMHAAAALCRKRQAGELVVASPVAGPWAKREFSEVADRVVILETPGDFHAVANVYRDWYDVSDAEVLEILSTLEGRSGP
jgi:predicted phosphoribosyltransferase